MDDSYKSLMSIDTSSHFDDDEFVIEALNDNETNEKISSPKIDISELISGQTAINLPKIKLDFNSLDTPRNSSFIRDRKRKKFSRRCLTSELNSENDQISFQGFQKKSKELKVTHSDSISFFKSPNVLRRVENTLSPSTDNANVSLELTPEFNKKSFSSPSLNRKSNSKNLIHNRAVLQKSYSENNAAIMKALASDNLTLIGDFSRKYALPWMSNSKHQDLKSITCHVLADLLLARYSEQIKTFTIVDCRYPYEYEGGHIRSAINLYTQEHIHNYFINNAKDKFPDSKRDILIFHCEFSSERGPNLCRYLRNKDRIKNHVDYPKLYYPEIYLLDGGYKEFYHHYKELCEPCGYLPMHAEDYLEDLRKFRSVCKSFETKYATNMKRNLRI